MASVFYIIIALTVVIYFWLKKRNNYWNDRGFLQSEKKGSFLGVTKDKTSFQGLDDHYKSFKRKAKAIGIYQFFVPSILPLDPELIKHILMKDFSYFHDRGMYHNKVELSLLILMEITLCFSIYRKLIQPLHIFCHSMGRTGETEEQKCRQFLHQER